MSNPVRALFVAYGGGHVAMALPVVREVERRLPEVDVQLMALTTGHIRASAVRPTLGYKDFVHLVDADAAYQWGQQLLGDNFSPDVPIEESIAYLGVNYLDLVAEHGEIEAADLYREGGRYAFRPLQFMRRVLEELKPDVVIATNSPRSEQAALESAQSLGIPSVGMVDGFAHDGDTYIHRDAKPDWTCVISATVRDRLLARGFPRNSIVVTGNPAFDGLFSESAVDLANRYLTENGWHELNVVLFAGHRELFPEQGRSSVASQKLPRRVETVLREHVRRREDLALIVRYHPSDWQTFPRLPDELRIRFSETSREPIHPLILASSVVVVQSSTVGLEAAVAGKPVISVESSPGAYSLLNLAQLGVSTPSATPSDLPGVIDRILADGGDPVSEEYRSDGKAASRVADVIAAALGESMPALEQRANEHLPSED